MLLEAIALTAAVCAGPYNRQIDSSGRYLATRPVYPAATADDADRAGFNGRLWIGRPIIGPGRGRPLGLRDADRAAFGAGEEDFGRVYAVIGGQNVVGFDAFRPIREEGLDEFKAARAQWLDERNYTGGVRTHVNDAYLYQVDQSRDVRPLAGPIAPRATITLPPEMPRFRSRMQVDSGSTGLIRVVRPSVAKAD